MPLKNRSHSEAKWIVAAGGYRSGSTLQYNLIGIYVEALGIGSRAGYFGPDDLDSLPEVLGVGVVKSHHIAEGPMGFARPDAWVRLVETGLAIPISTRRNEGDRQRSMAEKFGLTVEGVKEDPRWIQDGLNQRKWAELGALIQNYEELIHDPLSALRTMAEFLSLPWDQGAANTAVNESSLDAARSLADRVAPGQWDPVALLHSDHFSRSDRPKVTSWSQFGEDLLLAEFFEGRAHGVYAEIGAHDGITHSNTYLFERSGWTGLLVEPDPDSAHACKENRPRSSVVQAAAVPPGMPAQVTFYKSGLSDHSSLWLDRVHRKKLRSLTGKVSVQEIKVPAATLSEILERERISRLDFVTIDVEGHEAEVLKGFDLRKWRPALVIVERNYWFPGVRTMNYFRGRGYAYLHTTGVNDWFIDKRLDQVGMGRQLRRLASPFIREPARRAVNRVKHELKRAWRSVRAGIAWTY